MTGDVALQSTLTHSDIKNRILDGQNFIRQISVGTTPAKALENIKNADNKKDEMRFALQSEINEYIKNKPKAFSAWKAEVFHFFSRNENQEPITYDHGRYSNDLKKLFTQNYLTGAYDKCESALDAAKKQLAGVYGSSNINTGSLEADGRHNILTKYPPERYYTDLSVKEMRKRALDEIKEFPAYKDVKDEEIFFVDDATTAQETIDGEPTYIAYRKDKDTGFYERIENEYGPIRFGSNLWQDTTLTISEIEALQDAIENEKNAIENENKKSDNRLEDYYARNRKNDTKDPPTDKTVTYSDGSTASDEEQAALRKATMLWDITKTMCKAYIMTDEGKKQYDEVLVFKLNNSPELNKKWMRFKETAERYWDTILINVNDIPVLHKVK